VLQVQQIGGAIQGDAARLSWRKASRIRCTK